MYLCIAGNDEACRCFQLEWVHHSCEKLLLTGIHAIITVKFDAGQREYRGIEHCDADRRLIITSGRLVIV